MPSEPLNSASPRLSALIVAHDEEARLSACLACLAFADEILVVLDRCTDRSREIALTAGARILEGAWPIEGDRRNAGIEACTFGWILEVDADERVSPALAAEIRAVIATAPPGYFLIPYDNYIGGHLVRHGWGAYNGVSATVRLFSKGAKIWGRQLLHPKLELAGQAGNLLSPMQHYAFRDVGDMIGKLNRYTDLAARQAMADGKVPALGDSLRRIFSRFWKSFIARRGHREGVYGLALGLYSALYPILIYLKCRIDGASQNETKDGR